MSLAWSGVFLAMALLMLELIGGFLFVFATNSVWRIVSVALVAAPLAIRWYFARVRTVRKLRNALDSYSERKLRSAPSGS